MAGQCPTKATQRQVVFVLSEPSLRLDVLGVREVSARRGRLPNCHVDSHCRTRAWLVLCALWCYLSPPLPSRHVVRELFPGIHTMFLR